ncbi:flagellar biosynthesis protein FlhA [Desulforamulus hydrothermalis]|uniref:Flagellar biosynthesis protein FlhA n=1 Tax=Desulforamulus hydrothermalis Lam5 = DSM 18033 TaxID=1121428 RepID=K8E0U5_9FIRM|nr:flagellar biosynthesis protein FlhA [Desulforamulus hydrothermalis]CCO09180.1 flagellar export protein Flha [Desulforamulus hydrothermalis Lam5 = DSM 18033]SHH11171.1 flagellar biosynthesis protein FlhA [Desulforamulus hydrothermalis Lam5 = DSM 18033]
MAAPSTLAANLKQYSDLVIAGLIIGIVLLIIVPLPPGMLDFFLILSMSLGLVIMLITMFTTEPLQFSIFPSLLLVTTLYRLALNISSTRLILGEGAAGKVIEAFGQFVVGGNYVVGAVVFIIITVIQFVVITNGSGRVAEVGARFTLDAMPGKQMSIDADLNSGLITEDEARAKRERLQREADFFGAMDGASKFVRGDAIAGIVILIINILGGFVIGVVQLGLPMEEALKRFTILTIGDGLVAQIPALLISTAAGILVTRATSEGTFGKDIAKQFLNFPRVLLLAGVILGFIGLIPAMPNLLFLSMAAVLLYAAKTVSRERTRQALAEQQAQALQAQKMQKREPENVFSYFQVDPLEIEIGYNLIALTDESQGGDLLQRLAAVRRQCAAEMGILVRPIRIRDNMQLSYNAYVIKIRGVEVASGELMPGHHLAMDPLGQELQFNGIPTTEPTFNLPAWWVAGADRELVELHGFTVVDCSTVLVTHLTEILKQHAHELLGRQEVKELIEVVKEKNPAVVEELVPDMLSLGEIQKVLQNLLKERVPIRDLVTVLEALADGARINKDPDYLTDCARQSLSRTICQRYTDDRGKLSVITLHPRLEQAVQEAIQPTQFGAYPVLEPQLVRKLLDKLNTVVEDVTMRGLNPVVLCSPRVRLPFRRLIERYLPNLAVLSLNEIPANLDVEAIGTVSID